MNFSTYKNTLKFGFFQEANYRGEIWVGVASKVIVLLGVVFFWSVIGVDFGVLMGIGHFVSYFLIANAVSDLVDAGSMRFTRTLNKEIKLGTLNNHLLRPIHPIAFLYTSFLGGRGVALLISVIFFGIGLFILPTIPFVNVVLFIISILLAFLIAFSFNFIVGSVTFWTVEADHLQNVVSHVIKVFSGVLVPVSFFSGNLKLVVLLSPFPALGFLPASIIQAEALTQDIYISFFSSIVWVLILLPLSLLFWQQGLRRYEAVGI